METSRLSLVLTGAYQHPLGDLTPIEQRTSEILDTVDLPHRQMLLVRQTMLIPHGPIVDPLCVVIWNVAGVGLQTLPTDEERAAIAAQVLQVGLCPEPGEPGEPGGVSPGVPPSEPGGLSAGAIESTPRLTPGARLVPLAWQDLPPPPPCSGHSPCCVLRPSRGSRVIVQPAPHAKQPIPVRILVIPSK